MPQHALQHRAIKRDQGSIEWVAQLGRDATANPVAHQHRHQRYREARSRRHRIRLGESERPKQPAFLRFEREDRNERQGNDDEAEEERRAYFNRGLGHHLPMCVAAQALIWMSLCPGFDPLVGVLDHDHGGVDHGADRDRNSSE